MKRDQVVSWYEEKTSSILEKFGPGPRVHFHTGVMEDERMHDLPLEHGEALRQRLIAAQERALAWITSACDEAGIRSGERWLDVGCGLGGGTLYWAQALGVHVTAITIVERHVEIIERFAERAGVADRTSVLCADACSFDAELAFDVAIAVDCSCYLDRFAWFQRLAKLLDTGGSVLVFDTFSADSAFAGAFDDYWLTNIGSIADYHAAATQAGFVSAVKLDVSNEAANYWLASAQLTTQRLPQAAPRERSKLERSIAWHTHMETALRRGTAQCALLGFSRGR